MSDVGAECVRYRVKHCRDGLKIKVVCLAASPVGYDLTGAIARGVQGVLVKGTAPDNNVDCVRG
jgi:hypothetical protein